VSRYCINATWDDVPHLTEKQKQDMLASYPAHMRDARSKGIPMMGQGAIFPVDDDLISVDPFQIPVYWPKIGGMDFGYNHPFGAVELAYNEEADVIFVTKTYRASNATPIMHAAALKPWGPWIPWAWPHDGLAHDKGSGEQLAKQYEDHGLNMLGQRATFPDGTNGVEAGLMIMLDRMETGRLKVFSTEVNWFAEKRGYHRKAEQNGLVKIVKLRDDLLSATRYGIMMLRHALLPPALRSENRKKAQARNPMGGDPLSGF
jgi:hypothetical protein